MIELRLSIERKGSVFVEVLVVYAKKVNDTKEVKVTYLQELFTKSYDIEIINFNKEALASASKRREAASKQPNQIREALMKGYVEMSQINLSICSECLHVEYEAQHMVERLVSGR